MILIFPGLGFTAILEGTKQVAAPADFTVLIALKADSKVRSALHTLATAISKSTPGSNPVST
mgnify:CR=1 FL=1